MNALDTEALAALVHCEQAGRLDGLEVEYWIGGGLPPPLNRSDQLRLLTIDGRDTLEFARPYRDGGPDTPYDVLEIFQLPAEISVIRTVARLIRTTGVLTSRFDEEQDPRIADLLRTEIVLTVGRRSIQRVYYRAAPEALRELTTTAERLVELATTRGRRELHQNGRPWAPSPPG